MIAQDVAQKAKKLASRNTARTAPARNDLIRRRAIECVAITMIGDGVLGFVEPVRHVQLWMRGPRLWREMLRPFAEHPQLTRWAGAAGVAFGIWLAIQQEPETLSENFQ
jgi:hypothetical protein